ncbi:biotin-dependent carboxyltransferase family protein [Roseovarius nitratireducens]|uniref:5-oxoprolinase subunit C family protein n=1 Tax=Roseovarius nitratireducens TaxID=2044597 RepID=UPI000CE229DC|nr:biotin-dependent carboxyltransferase family protein [Roseovarius nitratireducens]
MSRALIVHQAGPGVTVQDLGRPGYLAYGLSRGGAADRLALYEGAALLGQAVDSAALEMAGMGGTFEATEDIRIALTGAPMRASIDGAALAWNASHPLHAGARLTIGPATAGVYGYLHVGGGIATPEILGARSAHLAAGIGAALAAGDTLPVGPDRGRETGLVLDADDRFSGGEVRVVAGYQTGMFPDEEVARFEETRFTRDARGNRMGVRLAPDGDGFASRAGLTVLSEAIVPGDIQVTGDGAPFVLMSECQTTGGYPRIGAVLPCDLPRVAQAAPGTALRLRFVPSDEALAAERRAAEARDGLRRRLTHLTRDPHDIRDLLSYQLISGVIAGNEEE